MFQRTFCGSLQLITMLTNSEGKVSGADFQLIHWTRKVSKHSKTVVWFKKKQFQLNHSQVERELTLSTRTGGIKQNLARVWPEWSSLRIQGSRSWPSVTSLTTIITEETWRWWVLLFLLVNHFFSNLSSILQAVLRRASALLRAQKPRSKRAGKGTRGKKAEWTVNLIQLTFRNKNVDWLRSRPSVLILK